MPCSESTALVTVHFTPGFLGLDIHPTTAAILAVARESQAGRASVVRPIPPSAALASTLSFTLALDWQDAGRDGGMGMGGGTDRKPDGSLQSSISYGLPPRAGTGEPSWLSCLPR